MMFLSFIHLSFLKTLEFAFDWSNRCWSNNWSNNQDLHDDSQKNCFGSKSSERIID